MTVAAGALGADPAFRRYLAARAVSIAGTLVTAVVLPVLMYRLTGSAAWTAAVVVAEALPYLLLAPVADSTAARRRCGAVLVRADLAGAALLASIPLAWWAEGLTGWHVLAVAGALQATFLLQEAAHRNTVRALVGPESAAAGGAAL
ncbi:MAG TPA: MFS transporter, partial [Pseudonocardiaceae bacterium]|nr:MFS transporter [Pseudonocardiaceae bacterium]